MKKVLLGTSAIALAGAAGSASAAEWNMVVGGYALSYLAYVTQDVNNGVPGVLDDRDGVDVFWDGEIHFKPSITLDNGIKIGANVQLEARAGAGGTPDTIDEAYTYVKGSFGEILLGDENSAGYKMHYGAPNFSGIGVNSPQTTFVPFSGAFQGVAAGADLFRGTLSSTYLENERNNDAGRITYFTPRFAGFQLGVSYARDATQNTIGMINTAVANPTDIIDIGANYKNSFGGFDVGLSARWGIATDNRVAVPGTDIGEDPTVLGFGANFGYGGFSIGGSWAEQNNSGDEDGTAYEVGIAYKTGPWGFSFNYLHGENVSDEDTSGDSGLPSVAMQAVRPGGSVDESLDHFQLGVQYSLAKGTNLNLAAGYVDFDEDGSVGPVVNTGNDIDGFYIATGIRISF